MRVRENFLVEYTNKLARLIKKDGSFFSLYNSLLSNKVKGYTKYKYQEVFAYAKELKEVLDKITSIVYKPHIKATVEEIVIRSELSHNLSNESFIDTVRDIKLWKNKDGEMTPEYVHTTNYVDTIVTYENQFIAFLVNLISEEVDDLLNNLTPLVKSLEEQYETKGVTYGKYSLFNEFKPFSYPFNKDYMENNTSNKKVFELLTKLRKKIKHIKASEFYRFNKNKVTDRNIVPTNILIHDLLYSFAYRFYLKNLQKVDIDEKNKKDTYYYNYVLTEFIKFLASQNVGKTNKSKLSSLYIDENKRLRFTTFSFKKGMYSYLISEDEDNLGFVVEVRLINKAIRSDINVTKDKVSTYYILSTLTYDEANKPYIDSIIDYKKDQYIQVILATQNNINLVFDSVINISSYQDYNNLLITNLIASFTMLFETSTYIYENKCPVCGKKYVALNEHNYTCEDCKSVYSLLTLNDKEMLWIKSFRRK